MKFHIFEEANEKFSVGNQISFADYVMETDKKVCDIIDSSDSINDENRDLIFESFCFHSFWEYMFYYGDKHTDGPALFKDEKVLITSASTNMYTLLKKISFDEHERNECERIVKQISDKSKNAHNDMQGIEIVNSYCKENDLNPLYLLIFYRSHLSALSIIDAHNEQESKEVKVSKSKKTKKIEKTEKKKSAYVIDEKENEEDYDNDDKKFRTIITSYGKDESKKKAKDTPSKLDKIKKQKAYYIYTAILLLYLVLLYLFSPNPLEIVVAIGVVFDFVISFITWQVSLNGNGNNWLFKISVAKLLSYLILGLMFALFEFFNPIVAIILFIIAQIYGFIKL